MLSGAGALLAIRARVLPLAQRETGAVNFRFTIAHTGTASVASEALNVTTCEQDCEHTRFT